MSSEKRHNTRILFDTQATVHYKNGSWTGKVIDISLQGVLINIPSDWLGNIGDHCMVSIQLDGSAQIKMACSIAHIENDHVGLHCDYIDIDSAAHLRRLVELNLGDEALLYRELAALQRH